MRIGIDAKFLTHPQKGGFKTYTENLINALSELDHENEYILYVDRQPLATDLIPDRPNFSIKIVPGNHKIFQMPLREQFALPRQIHKDQIDVFHGPCLTAPIFLNVPTVVTIHDMIWYYPNRFSPHNIQFNKRKLMEWYYKVVPLEAARKSNAIITVSNASKRYITEYLNISSDKVFVTYEAANKLFHPMVENESLEKSVRFFGLKSNYILGIGSADPRKNIKFLIKAYALLPDHFKDTYNLAIVWNHKLLAPESFLEVQKLDATDYVHFLDNVSDEQLLTLYNQASLFIFPSLEEGFGLPPLEAMACGTPVLAANNSSIPEIVGDAAMQFDAHKADELAELIMHVLTDSELQLKMQRRGIDRAATFSWKRCGLETIEVYKKAINL